MRKLYRAITCTPGIEKDGETFMERNDDSKKGKGKKKSISFLNLSR